MSNTERLEAKINELEMKLTFQDDLLHTLNEVVTRQDKDIQNLWAANRLLKHDLNQMKDDSNETHQENELPPHY